MSSLWNDPHIQECIRRLDPQTKARYKRIGDAMYDTIDFCDPDTTTAETATQIKLMLRDGLKTSMLTPEEKEVFDKVYGKEALKKYQDYKK